MTLSRITVETTRYNPLHFVYAQWLEELRGPDALPVIIRGAQASKETSNKAGEVVEFLTGQGYRIIQESPHEHYFTNGNTYANYYAGTHLSVMGRNKDEVDKLIVSYKERFGEVRKINVLKILIQGETQYTLGTLGTPCVEIDPDNYTPEVVQKFEMVRREISADKPRGRVAIITGYPGTGKTFLIRALLSDYTPDTDYIIANTEQVLDLAKNLYKFLNLRMQGGSHRKTVFILEDADSAIAPRSTTNLSAIQNILNLSDGLMGESLDIRLVITSNVSSPEIDPAIVRPGRLIAHLDVTPLGALQARKVFQRVSGGGSREYKTPTSLAKVYEDALDYQRSLESTVAAE